MNKPTNSTAGPAQYLALGAGLYRLVDEISAKAYPIQGWGDMMEAINSLDDINLIIPGGRKSLHKEILKPTVFAFRPILGDQYFPIKDQQDFAQKAGLILISLARRHFGSPSPCKSPDAGTAREIEAFKQEHLSKK